MADKYDVFISYARSDYKDKNNNIVPNSVVEKILTAFKKNGISFWIDEDGILTGDKFAPVIGEAIKNASVFVFISTKNSNESYWTLNEVSTAHFYNKPILPIKCDDSSYANGVMLYLAALEYCDYFHFKNKAIDDLVGAVKRNLPHKAGGTLNTEIDILNNKISNLEALLVQMQETIIAQLEEQKKTNQLLSELKQGPEVKPVQLPPVFTTNSDSKSGSLITKEANVFFVIDMSQRMLGRQAKIVNSSMRNVVEYFAKLASSKSDTDFKLSVLSYSANAKWQYPSPQDISQYIWTDLSSSYPCNLGLALAQLNDAMTNGPRGFFSNQSQYGPSLIVFVSIGKPTDQWNLMFEALKGKEYYKTAKVASICIGNPKEMQTIKEGSVHRVNNGNELTSTMNQIVSEYVASFKDYQTEHLLE